MNYDDFIEPPFNYTGSKFKLLEQLIPLFDKSKTEFVNLFAGGGSVYSNVAHLYKCVIINGIISDLMAIHERLIHDVEGTISTVKSLVVSKEDQAGYNVLRASYNAEPTPEKLWALMLCCTNNMMRFNQSLKFNQTFGKRTFNERTEIKARNFATKLRPHFDKLRFHSGDFATVIKPCAGNMIYCDPPYSNTEAGYNAYWKLNDDLRLFDFLKQVHEVGGSFAVSGTMIHDGSPCRLIQLLSEGGFNVIKIQCDYNKVSRKGNKETQEVLITNYQPPKVEETLFSME